MLQLEVIGNIGNNAEIKPINGKECVSFNVAHSEKVNGVAHTQWVNVLMRGNGGGLTQYLTRGAKVFVRGNMVVKTYQDKNGQFQYAINVYNAEVQLCDLKGGNAAPQAVPVPAPAPTTNEDGLPF